MVWMRLIITSNVIDSHYIDTVIMDLMMEFLYTKDVQHIVLTMLKIMIYY